MAEQSQSQGIAYCCSCNKINFSSNGSNTLITCSNHNANRFP